MASPTCLQRTLFRAQGCIYDFQRLSNVQKAALITVVALTVIGLLTTAVLGRLSVIRGLNLTAQHGMFMATGVVATIFLISLAIYHCRKASNPFPNGQVADMGIFSKADDPDIKKIRSYATHLMLQAAHAINNKKTAQYLFDFLANPKPYLVATQCSFGGHNVWLFPGLSECSCCNSGNFNRFFNTRRQKLEDKMVSDATKQFPSDSTDCIRYLGFGAGGLLQDFINVGKLMRAGYKKIDITLSDPQLNVGEEQKKKDQFEFLKLVAKELGITLNITYCQALSEIKGDFHIISAIDFDDFMKTAFSDAIEIQNHLKENGRYYLAFDTNDFIFDHNGLIDSCNYDERPPTMNQIINSLKDLIYDQEQVHITIVEDKLHIFQWVHCLSAMIKNKGVKKVFITLPAPHKTNYLGAAIDELNPSISKDSIRGLFKLLMPNIEIDVHLFSNFEELKGSKAQDVILWLGGANFQNRIEAQIKWMRKNHPKAIQYYACAGFKGSDEEHPVWEGMWRYSANSSIQFFTPDHNDHITSLMSID